MASAAMRHATHEAYVVLHRQYEAGVLSDRFVNTILTTSMAQDPDAFPAIGISHGALAAYRANDYRNTRGIQRAHLVERIKTVRLLLDRDEPAGEDELFGIWREADKVIIALSAENSRIHQVGWIDLPQGQGLFRRNPVAGFAYARKREGRVLAQLHDELTASGVR